ncbi:hypothetical protein TSOC_014060, partial [Tetrabaena socialis]
VSAAAVVSWPAMSSVIRSAPSLRGSAQRIPACIYLGDHDVARFVEVFGAVGDVPGTNAWAYVPLQAGAAVAEA